MFGEDFSGYQDPEAVEEAAEQLTTPTAPQNEKDLVAAPASSDPSKAKKGKLAAKSTGLTYQFQIMELLGIPRNEIKQFADPIHWMKYFPPIAQQDCNAVGARIDWRRSFVTSKSFRPAFFMLLPEKPYLKHSCSQPTSTRTTIHSCDGR